RARTPTAFISWLRVDAHTGIFLQRDLFHLRAGLDAVLRRAGKECRRLFVTVRARKCAWTTSARTFVRHDRPQTDDHNHLWTRRYPAGPHRLAFSRGTADRPDANAGVDDYFL